MYKNKVLLFLIGFTLIIIFTVSIFMIAVSNAQLLDSAKEKLMLLSEKNALHFNSNIELIENTVDNLNLIIMHEFDSQDIFEQENGEQNLEEKFIYLERSIYDIGKNSKEVKAFYFYLNPDFFGTHNNISFAFNESSEFTKQRVLPETDYYSGELEMEWFFKPISEKTGFWFEPYYWEHFNANIITYSKAVLFHDDVLGVIGIDLDVNYLVNYFEESKFYEDAETFILDVDHNTLIHTGNVFSATGENSASELNFEDFPSELKTTIKSHIEEQKVDHKKDVVYESDNYLVSHSDLSNGWIMMTYTPKSEILAPVNSFFTFVLIVVLIFIIFAVIASRFIANLISKPLESLALKIKGFKIDANTKLEKTGVDEIDTITDSFNHMAAYVNYSYEIIKEKNIQLEKSFKASETLANNLEELLNLTSSISIMAANDETDYLINVLRISKNMIKHADESFIAKNINGNLEYFCSVGEFEQNKTEKLFVQLNKKESDVLSSQFEENIEYTNYLYSPLEFADNLLGAIVLANSGEESIVFSSEDKKFLDAFSNLAASYFGIQQQMRIKTKFRESILYAIIKLVELHDPYTKGHSESVSKFSVLIARQMGLTDDSISTIKWAGLVHDIGKILVPKEILTKPTSLNDEEYSIIKKHSEYGAKVLRASEEVAEVASIVKYHHERWDGKGYPDGIKGLEIPIESRIIAVADGLDAMISDRPYRKGLPLKIARDEIVKNSGTQFDPEVVGAFLEIDLVNEFIRVDDELEN